MFFFWGGGGGGGYLKLSVTQCLWFIVDPAQIQQVEKEDLEQKKNNKSEQVLIKSFSFSGAAGRHKVQCGTACGSESH